MRDNSPMVFGCGAMIGTLGGLIGLGGAEFRLPLLIGIFRFPAIEAVILNKFTSLIVVAAALLFRTKTVPLDELVINWTVVANLLAGSLFGAWFGAGWALLLRSENLYRAIALLLVFIAVVLIFGHDAAGSGGPLFSGGVQIVVGILAGFGIGIVASLLGVAGGELLIPTLIILFGADIKLAGSLSLAVSLPTMLIGFARYSKDNSFATIGKNLRFVLYIAFGSLVGAFIGGQLLGSIPGNILLPALSMVLLVSAVKVWRHQ